MAVAPPFILPSVFMSAELCQGAVRFERCSFLGISHTCNLPPPRFRTICATPGAAGGPCAALRDPCPGLTLLPPGDEEISTPHPLRAVIGARI